MTYTVVIVSKEIDCILASVLRTNSERLLCGRYRSLNLSRMRSFVCRQGQYENFFVDSANARNFKSAFFGSLLTVLFRIKFQVGILRPMTAKR